MATTSYTTLPSSSYVGLGSQGNLLSSAHFGTYDTGVGSLTSHPYQYQTTNYSTYLTDNQQPSSYSDDFLRSTHANGVYPTLQPSYYSTDRYAQQSTHHQDSTLNDHTISQTQRFVSNEHYPTTEVHTTQVPHRTTLDHHHHQTSQPDTVHHRSPPPMENQSQTNHARSEHNSSAHPSPPKHQQRHPSPPKQQQQHHPTPPKEQHHPTPPKQVRSEHQNSKQLPPVVRQRSLSNSLHDPLSAATAKTNNPLPPTKTTKSTQMRAAAIKRKEKSTEQKRKDGNFPGIKKKSPLPPPPPPPPPPKSQPKQKPILHSPSNDEKNEKHKSKSHKKQSRSASKQRKSRRDDYQTEENNSSVEGETPDEHLRSKSKKRTAFSDSRHEKYPILPPVRHGRVPPYYDPAYDYPYPAGHLLRGRYPYYDDYPPYGTYSGRYDHRHRHLYEDTYDAPPYVSGFHDPYDGFFDYEKRKGKSKTKKHKDKKEPTTDHEAMTANETERDDDGKSVQSKKSKHHKKANKTDDENDTEDNRHDQWPRHYYDAPYYDEHDPLEIWRQERNNYLKKEFKPSVHDVLYSQQRMKADSYLENQRRRALRDTQGYYFPYKKYTLKDYRDLQKHESHHNPYSAAAEATLDRKQRARKRLEYSTHVERQMPDTFTGQQKTPREMPPRKPWHLSNGEPNDPEKSSKRERALEYAKVQIVKNRPQKAPKNRSEQSDPTEQYVNSLFPQHNDDERSGSVNGQDHQSNDEDEE